MNDIKPKKIAVTDLALSDEKIPRNLILMYDTTPFILKAGLEWKANKLFGGAGYSLHIELISYDFEKKYYLAKATLIVLGNGAIFENYGEATPENSNSMMQKNLLHLAITRAECRVLRMATACGYASYDEVMTLPKNGHPEKIEVKNGNYPATAEQLKTIFSIAPDTKINPEMTKQEASEIINYLSKKK
jgi:hypothetical protein